MTICCDDVDEGAESSSRLKSSPRRMTFQDSGAIIGAPAQDLR